jgi:hypothetical protein
MLAGLGLDTYQQIRVEAKQRKLDAYIGEMQGKF